MPIEMRMWRIDGNLTEIVGGHLDQEDRLETLVTTHPEVLGEKVLMIDRQVTTAFGGRIDLLAIDGEGGLVVIELKRGRTPRDVVAQALDYGSWVRSLGHEDVTELFEASNGIAFEKSFSDCFGSPPPEALNETHRLLIVASEMDPSTERIVGHLVEDYGVPINVVFFRSFEDDGREYLGRTWLIDPSTAQAHSSRASVRRTQEPWNGQDWYVSFGEDQHRNWEDARRYGFISGGGGKWYTQTLYALPFGARVFVHIPTVGYVGVGTVLEEAKVVTDFTVSVDGEQRSILEVPLKAPNLGEYSTGEHGDLETFVRVEWETAVPRDKAFWESGLFANQNTACKLRSRFTIERVSDHFQLDT